MILFVLACGGQPAPRRTVWTPEPLACPEGAVQRSQGGGFEQWCEADGVRKGPSRTWHARGVKAREGSFLEGQRDGLWIDYYPSGAKQSEGYYLAGNLGGAWTWWFEEGTVSRSGSYQLGKQQGVWTEYWPVGRKRGEGTFERGLRDGLWATWHENGQRASEVVYAADLPVEGARKYWDHSGRALDPDMVGE